MQVERAAKIGLSQERQIRSLLETDRIWCAYALADLDPPHRERSTWRVADGALVMVYAGLSPALLFAHGEPSAVERLFDGLPADRYQYALRATDRALIRDRLQAASERPMWRMHLHTNEFAGLNGEQAARLSFDDLPAILKLIDSPSDGPDSFQSEQLVEGVYYGIWRGGELVSLAGTHVVSERASVAAIGNVFTRSDHRGSGLATRSTAAVAAELLHSEIQTIVLNVEMDNSPALQAYSKLGFWPYCGYYEGSGTLTAI